MKFEKQSIPEVVLITPKVHGDHRGYFMESFRQDEFEANVCKTKFIQDNESFSTKGTLRGLHYQLPPFSQSKLVRVTQGEVLDVAVDIRKGSPTFGHYVSVVLSSENKQQLFVPRGFAHGFLVLSETAVFNYKVDNYYSPECDRGIRFDDASIGEGGVDWKLKLEELLLSEKDKLAPTIAERVSASDVFDYQQDLYEV
jgi:dTDP-4-dehydrorhamnose 3,5-epimerase